MDLGRFHYALDTVLKDWQATNALDQVQQVVNALSNLANNPTHPPYTDAYKQQLESARAALEASTLNHPQLEVAEFIKEFELENFIGERLFDSMIETIRANNLSPQNAIAALQQLLSGFAKKLSNMKAVNDAFTELEAPYDAERDGDSEIEIKIPVAEETKTLSDLAKEVKGWSQDLRTIAEVFDPDRTEPVVRVISTGSWQFYLASTPAVLFGIATCVRQLNGILAELVKTKKLLAELISTDAPKTVVGEYERHITELPTKQLDKLAESLVDQYYKGDDEGRKAELKNALKQALKRLSKRLAEGSKVSLRLTKPAAPKVANPDSPTPEERHLIENANAIEESRQAVLREVEATQSIEHDPSIVHALPAPEPDEAN